MLPQAGSDQTPRPRKPGAMVYLKPEMLTTSPKQANVLAVKADPNGKFGASVILKLAFEGQTIFYRVDIKKNPNYAILTGRFGHDENDWPGQKILLGLEQDEFSGGYNVRVTFPNKGK